MYIRSLRLENIKAFDKLDIEFTRGGEIVSSYAGLNVFVGGNSSGKSTLLKCIALAISGPTIANQQLITPVGWIRKGEKSGKIELEVHSNPIYDRLLRGGNVPDSIPVGLAFEIEPDASATVLKPIKYLNPYHGSLVVRGLWRGGVSGWLLGAYGPMRRQTGSSTEALQYASGRGKLASCVTLFREDAALSESEAWLKQEYARELEQQSQGNAPNAFVEHIQAFLNDGLLPEGFRIAKVSVDHVYMTTPNGGDLPMRDLSDGCRSTFALMLDIIHNMALAYPRQNLFEQDKQGRMVVNKPGVILIDEVEAHLHPSWQRLICEWFKTRFPQVQFFLTTHSPLIAQAADEGGLFVLPLPDEIASGHRIRRLSAQEQKRIALGSAEKVLLGEAFGLKHTWSPRAERLVEEWERLAAQRNAAGKLPPEAEKKYTELSEQMEIVFDDLPEETIHA